MLIDLITGFPTPKEYFGMVILWQSEPAEITQSIIAEAGDQVRVAVRHYRVFN